MKKFVYSMILIVSLVLLAGCNLPFMGDKIVCSGEYKDDSMNLKATTKVTATFKNDKISKLDASMTFDNEQSASTICSLFTIANNYAESEKDKVKFKCNGKTILLYDYAEIVDSESKEELNKMTKEDFKKAMKEQDLTCK